MNWEAMGAVGEIFGAVVVCGTLVYLALQARDTRASVVNSGNVFAWEQHMNHLKSMAGNSELAHLVAKSNHGEELTEGERLQVQAYFNAVFMACLSGHMTEGEENPRTDVGYIMHFFGRMPGAIDEWHVLCPLFRPLAPDFCAEVDRLLGERSA